MRFGSKYDIVEDLVLFDDNFNIIKQKAYR